jgi:plasmid stability protein
MPFMPAVTIRDVPDETRNVLAARAARNGQSLQEYLRGTLMQLADRPDIHELFDDVRARKDASGSAIGADTILDAVHGDRQ